MEVIINNNLFNVKLAITDKDIQDGMMGKKFNDEFDGMLFLMDEGQHSFWMKNCITSLDILFISDGSVIKIYSDCPPCREQDDSKCPRYDGVGDMILEINGGDCIKYDITEGDSILIKE